MHTLDYIVKFCPRGIIGLSTLVPWVNSQHLVQVFSSSYGCSCSLLAVKEAQKSL